MRYFLLHFCFFPFLLCAQNVGIGTSNPDPSAKLDIQSTTGGVLIPRLTTTERNAIPSPVNGLLIYNSVNSRFEFYNGSSWGPISSASNASAIADTDQDTKVETEQNADEDMIRFTVGSRELGVFKQNRLEVNSPGFSTIIGQEAGHNDNGSTNYATYLGYRAGKDAVDGFANTYIGANAGGMNELGRENTIVGVSAGWDSEGSFNTYVGRDAGRLSMNGQDNTYIGYSAGKSGFGSRNTFIGYSAGENSAGSNNIAIGRNSLAFQLTGDRNIAIGNAAGASISSGSNNILIGDQAGSEENNQNNTIIGTLAGFNTSGSDNTIIGYKAGENASGSGNVLLGTNSGRNELGNNKLYIDNSSTSHPLIYGDFQSNRLEFNGIIKIGPDPAAEGGLIQYNDNQKDFLGYDGEEWLSLTSKYDRKSIGISNQMNIENQKIIPQPSIADDRFGQAVKLHDNFLFIGAVGDDEISINSGALYVYSFDQTTCKWVFHQKITFTEFPVIGFGNNIDAFGDEIVVTSSDNVHFLKRNQQTGLYQFTYSHRFDLQEFNNTGIARSIALGDSFAVIGLPSSIIGFSAPESHQGHIAVYKRINGIWSFLLIERTTITVPMGNYGQSVSISGDYLAVTSPKEEKLYVYDLTTIEAFPVIYVESNLKNWQVSFDNDLIAVSNPSDNEITIFEFRNGITLKNIIRPGGLFGYQGFGNSISLDNNYLIIGIPENDEAATSAGLALIYKYDLKCWNQVAKIKASDSATDEEFGFSVSGHSDHFVVGVPKDFISGAAYFYR